ncbi:MAG: hypothetical protein C0432_01110 [Candidatus Puniceispirillum sp.]|nr:hypothetical protein [Candidatus Pelagibacter sp.]MBA4282881.1 hypothetical protein [Candidatus Puniceispirillum sp.]
MNYKKILFLKIIILSLCSYPCLSLEADSDEDDTYPKTISIIDIEACRNTADAIRDDFARDFFDEQNDAGSAFSDDELNEAMFAFSISQERYIPTLEEQNAAEEKKRAVTEKECERQNKIKQYFREYETDIHKEVKNILSTYSDQLKIYKKHVKKMWPSQAILEITKDVAHTPRSIDLLTLIEDYFEYTWQMEGYIDDQVGITASDRIFSYYLDEYNKQAALNNDPHTMDRHAHDLLQLCLKHFPKHPLIDSGDPEQIMTHINYAVSRQLFILNTWYLNNPKLVKTLLDIFSMQKIFNLGVKFLGCTTYGITNQYCDLAYMLKRSKFIGIKIPLLNNPSQYQHL